MRGKLTYAVHAYAWTGSRSNQTLDCHYHLSESHRGVPGTATVDWDGIFRALGEEGYHGLVGLESLAEVPDAMRAATCIWRRLAPSSDSLLRDGLQF